MHPHQRRVSKKLSTALEIAIGDGKQPESFQNFQSLYDWVKSVTDRVTGVGKMTAYDVARRLGAWLDLKPDVVYLHAGTADGAQQLGVEGKMAHLGAFPQELQALGATHLENFLCIYKEHLQKLDFNPKETETKGEFSEMSAGCRFERSN